MGNPIKRRVAVYVKDVTHAPSSERRLTNEELNKKYSTNTKPRLWKVIITHKVHGYSAPSFYVETTEQLKYKAEFQALESAKERSGLSRFDSWNFEVVKLNMKLIKGRWVQNRNEEDQKDPD